MWNKLSQFIIKRRLYLISVLFLITLLLGWKVREIEMTYDFAKVVPDHDEEMQYFQTFKEQFGEDGNIMILGFRDSSLYELENFRHFYELNQKIKGIRVNGDTAVNDVVSLASMNHLVKNEEQRKFEVQDVFDRMPETEEELDSLLTKARNVRFFEGQIFNPESKASIIAIAIQRDILNSANRQQVVDAITDYSAEFQESTGIKVYSAGLPYIRSIMVEEVKSEVILFLILAAIVTSFILFFFFRSLFTVLLTFTIIVTVVIWTFGILVLFGFKVSLLTGMLPALIIVIGIPNCIYMLNKYHIEYRKHNDKIKAVGKAIQKIGYLTLMTNTTTAIGFFVLYFTGIDIISEFGLVAGVVSLSTFIITIITIPTLLILLPAPNKKQLKHLDLKLLRKVSYGLEQGVLRYRPAIYICTILLLGVAVVGMYKIEAVAYMTDDLPNKGEVREELAFLEDNFGGVMPLEIVVDMKKPNSTMSLGNLRKLDKFNNFLDSLEHVSPPLSILNVIKSATQAYYNGMPEHYRLPSSNNERLFLMRYLRGSDQQNELLSSLVDSTGQTVRFTSKVADLGTEKTNLLVKEKISHRAQEIFGDEFDVKITGTTLLFLKGNQYLINGLTSSLIFAFLLISILMALLFKSLKMVIISLLPNLIPLILTIGIMGLFQIPLKPSTALIFSIAFGIAVDDTLHYLSKYRQELTYFNGNILKAVTHALEEAGVSMIYTSIVLFCGFIIFAFSNFGGTVALGILTSVTLFFAMITNLTILPSLLLTFSKGYRNNLFPIVKKNHNYYMEEEDEEIDVSRLKVENQEGVQSEKV